MSLRDLNIEIEYRIPSNNIVEEFYIPTLKNAIKYKRAVGFFSSTALIDISRGISGLISNDGAIELIISPRLSDEDKEAIKKGYENRDSVISKSIIETLYEPKNYFEKERLNLIANLIAEKRLEIKVVFLEKNNGISMYHEKVGIIEDSEGNIVAFSGSMNESSNALTMNYEAIDVFCSWNDSDLKRVNLKKRAFNNIWNNTEEYLVTKRFIDVEKEIIHRYKKGEPIYDIDKKESLEKLIIAEEKEVYNINKLSIPKDIILEDYQERAILTWMEKGSKGIFDMATGTGKTFTGLGAATMLADKLNNNIGIIIVCPFKHLVDQWVEDIEKWGLNPIIGHSSSIQKNFKQDFKRSVINFNLGINNGIGFCFVCTNSTFASDYIQSVIKMSEKDILIIIDEAHNFGSKRLSETFKMDYKYRLGLSATFERQGDKEGTKKIFDFFGERCIEYPIEKAIKDGKLAKYKYYPVIVTLTDVEIEMYNKITAEMIKHLVKDKKGNISLDSMGELLAMKRARVIAGAKNKGDMLVEKIKQYKDDRDILIYCGAAAVYDENGEKEAKKQINFITKKLYSELGMSVSKFTAEESSKQRKIILDEFAENGSVQALVAIKCLDEGVNIPSIRTAFILASTTNPKEYIQRRGRVLRRYPGKEFAEIYDFVTIPRDLNEVNFISEIDRKNDLGLIRKELKRIYEFARIAEQDYYGMGLISDITEAYNIDISEIFEEDLDDEIMNEVVMYE